MDMATARQSAALRASTLHTTLCKDLTEALQPVLREAMANFLTDWKWRPGTRLEFLDAMGSAAVDLLRPHHERLTITSDDFYADDIMFLTKENVGGMFVDLQEWLALYIEVSDTHSFCMDGLTMCLTAEGLVVVE
jgi:hypothetical protein